MSNDPRVTQGRKTSKFRPGSFEVQTVQVHPGIWRTAMALAGGQRARINVLTATKVEVR